MWSANRWRSTPCPLMAAFSRAWCLSTARRNRERHWESWGPGEVAGHGKTGSGLTAGGGGVCDTPGLTPACNTPARQRQQPCFTDGNGLNGGKSPAQGHRAKQKQRGSRPPDTPPTEPHRQGKRGRGGGGDGCLSREVIEGTGAMVPMEITRSHKLKIKG